MRLNPPLLVGAMLMIALGGLILRREAHRAAVADSPPPTLASSEALVALPWDKQAERRVGGVLVSVPTGWASGGGPELKPLKFAGNPERSLESHLQHTCDHPVVQRWREQWRGECLSNSDVRIRGAVIRAGGGWQGAEARYPDGQDARMAPRVARMLASMETVED